MSAAAIPIGGRTACATAAVALAVAALTSRHYLLVLPAAGAAALAVARWHGRQLLGSTGALTRYAARRRHGAHPDGLFPLVCPGATVAALDVDSTPVGTVRDGYGTVALLELGDRRAAVHTGPMRTPAPAGLGTAASTTGPAVTAQTLVVARGPYQRVFVALRAGGDGGAWRDAQLREALAAAVRRATRRLGRLGTPARPLDPRAVAAAVTWAVDAVGGTAPAEVTEEWDHLRVGGMLHATLRVHPRAADLPTELLVRLLRAPATTVAVGWTAGEATLRLSAPTPAALATAVAALLADLPGTLVPRDGDQYPGLRATLPLAAATSPTHGPGPDATGPEVPASGLLIGVDRVGRPIHLRLDQDRAAPVRVVVVGGPAAARVLGARLRALAAGEGMLPAVPVVVSVLDALTAADAATLGSADVVVCQPLTPGDAALVAAALHLTRAGSWLSRIDGDMIAVISDGVVRWARLAAAADEQRSHPGMAGVVGA